MREIKMTDIEILTESYEKYKDKKGKKAQSLKSRIESFKAFEELINQVKTK